MKSTVTPLTISAEMLCEMEAVARRAQSNEHDLATRREACRLMDEMREEIRRRQGTLDIGVPAIRELRDR